MALVSMHLGELYLDVVEDISDEDDDYDDDYDDFDDFDDEPGRDRISAAAKVQGHRRDRAQPRARPAASSDLRRAPGRLRGVRRAGEAGSHETPILEVFPDDLETLDRPGFGVLQEE